MKKAVLVSLGIMLILSIYFLGNASKPFIFAIEYDSIEPQHKKVISDWLVEAQQINETHVFKYEIDDYIYLYGKGITDFDISYIYTQAKGVMKIIHTLGHLDEDVFVSIKYNEQLCCTEFIYETKQVQQ